MAKIFNLWFDFDSARCFLGSGIITVLKTAGYCYHFLRHSKVPNKYYIFFTIIFFYNFDYFYLTSSGNAADLVDLLVAEGLTVDPPALRSAAVDGVGIRRVLDGDGPVAVVRLVSLRTFWTQRRTITKLKVCSSHFWTDNTSYWQVDFLKKWNYYLLTNSLAYQIKSNCISGRESLQVSDEGHRKYKRWKGTLHFLQTSPSRPLQPLRRNVYIIKFSLNWLAFMSSLFTCLLCHDFIPVSLWVCPIVWLSACVYIILSARLSACPSQLCLFKSWTWQNNDFVYSRLVLSGKTRRSITYRQPPKKLA